MTKVRRRARPRKVSDLPRLAAAALAAVTPGQTCTGIPVHVCPGVTAASAAAASLGKSLTLRGLARRLTFVTAHVRAGEAVDLDWAVLADPQATLAIYMGKAAAGEVSTGLIEAGLPGDTPVLLVENASLPDERHFATRLDLLPLAARTALGDGPAVILVGQAMASSAVTSVELRIGTRQID